MQITCKDLCMRYEGHVAFEGLSFTLRGGEFLCIVGENGSGKTTLVKGLLGLKAPAAGEILREGGNTRGIGYLPQHAQAQRDFPATAGEIVRSGCLNALGRRPFYSRRFKRRADELMERLGVLELRRTPFYALSGGQQQRVLLARALCAADELLLLDEPTAGLDPVVSAEVYGIAGALHKTRGMGVILVTHDLKRALPLADKVLHLGAGSYFFGAKNDYLATPYYQNLAGGQSV